MSYKIFRSFYKHLNQVQMFHKTAFLLGIFYSINPFFTYTFIQENVLKFCNHLNSTLFYPLKYSKPFLLMDANKISREKVRWKLYKNGVCWTNPGNRILQNSKCTVACFLSHKLSKTDRAGEPRANLWHSVMDLCSWMC